MCAHDAPGTKTRGAHTCFPADRPDGLWSVIGTGTDDDWERQMAFGGLNYSWCLQTLGAYGPLSLSAGCLLTVWVIDISLSSTSNFLKRTLLSKMEKRELLLVTHTMASLDSTISIQNIKLISGADQLSHPLDMLDIVQDFLNSFFEELYAIRY